MAHAGKEIVPKSDAPESLNVLEEAKVAGRVKRAAASAIAAASVKAKLLADQEEREMKRLIEDVIDKQVISTALMFTSGLLQLSTVKVSIIRCTAHAIGLFTNAFLCIVLSHFGVYNCPRSKLFLFSFFLVFKQSKKLELKLKFLNELEAAIGRECETVDRDRLNFFADHARIAAQHVGGASNSNPLASPPRQQHQALVLAQPPPPPPPSFPGQMYGHHGFQNHQMPNHAAFVQQQMYQGLANSMNAGAMGMQPGHFQRQMMIAGTAPHMLGRQQLGPPEINNPPPPVMMGRPMISSSDPGPGGPLPGMPGLARPVPGGMPQ